MTDIDSNQTDLVDAIRVIFKTSKEPLTVNKIRDQLSAPFDHLGVAELTDVMKRQVAANVVVICPKYRSSQDRYWDRPLREHAKVLLRDALADGPIPGAELRKKFPKYLRHLTESVLDEELAKGTVHRHPPVSLRAGFRFGLERADLRSYATTELEEALARLVELGFALSDARETFMQLLQETEWAENAPDEPAPVGVVTAESDSWNSTVV